MLCCSRAVQSKLDPFQAEPVGLTMFVVNFTSQFAVLQAVDGGQHPVQQLPYSIPPMLLAHGNTVQSKPASLASLCL